MDMSPFMDDHNLSRNFHLSGAEPRCPINVAARRSGLSTHVIRAWERRYSAITPDRTSKLRRLYSDYEIRRLVLLRQAVELGHRIGEIARLPIDELRALVGRDTLPGVEASPRIPLSSARLVEVAVDAVRQMQALDFSQALLQATRILDIPDLFDDFVDSLIQSIALQREQGDLRLVHENFACAQLRLFLSGLLASSNVVGGPGMVVATLPGQGCELSALMAAVTASRTGWDVIYAGPGLPAEELAYAVEQRDARAVALGRFSAEIAEQTNIELKSLRLRLGDQMPIFCDLAVSHDDQPEPGAVATFRLASMSDFSSQLAQIGRA